VPDQIAFINPNDRFQQLITKKAGMVITPDLPLYYGFETEII